MSFWPFGRREIMCSGTEVGSITYELEIKARYAYSVRNWSQAECLCRDILARGNCESQSMARNMLGRICERQQRPDEAIALYEANIRERYTVDYSYRRLATVYRRCGKLADEERILRAAIRALPEPNCGWHTEQLRKLGR